MRAEVYGTIFGVISLLVNSLRVIQSIVNLIRIFKTENKEKHHLGDLSLGEPTFSDNDDVKEVSVTSDVYDRLRTRQYFTLLYGIIMIIACFLLIYGMRKRRSFLLLPWLVLAISGVVTIVVMIFFDGFILTGTQVYSNVLYIVIQSLLWPTVFFIWIEFRSKTDPLHLRNNRRPKRENEEPATPLVSATINEMPSTSRGRPSINNTRREKNVS